MRNNKYDYSKVIQQNYGTGWEDVSTYETDSTGYLTQENRHSGKFIVDERTGKKRELTLLTHDLREYRTLGYPTRVIQRRELKIK